MSTGRTERPTPRRLREARRRGEIPSSRQLTAAASLLAGVAALSATADATSHALADAIRLGLADALGGGEPWPALIRSLHVLARTATPPCAAAALGAAVAGAVQARGLFAPGVLAFRLDRLHLAKGLARVASPSRWGTAALGCLETAALLLACWHVLSPGLAASLQGPRLGPGALLRSLAPLTLRVTLTIGALLAVFGAIDLALVSRRHRRNLMMTRGEVLRELREDGGDPRRKLERRRLHRALAEAAPVRRAACLVVNPTHLAVALQHARGSEEPPLVLAKAAGAAAATLRREASRAGVPIVRDVPLARALFHLAEVGDAIPVELYDAAAAVLVHVHRASVKPT